MWAKQKRQKGWLCVAFSLCRSRRNDYRNDVCSATATYSSPLFHTETPGRRCLAGFDLHAEKKRKKKKHNGGPARWSQTSAPASPRAKVRDDIEHDSICVLPSPLSLFTPVGVANVTTPPCA